jgi:hypothetical protein
VKGDRVEIVVDTGDGTRTYEVAATRAGRRVEVSTGRGIVEVSEVTRTGTAVRTARFMASRVVALVEHPADNSADLAAPAIPAPSFAQPSRIFAYVANFAYLAHPYFGHIGRKWCHQRCEVRQQCKVAV